MTTKPEDKDYIPLEKLRVRCVYVGVGQQVSVAAYAGNGWFIGIPDDPSMDFLYAERHADCDAGAFFPQLEFEDLPEDIVPVIFKRHSSGDLWCERNAIDVPVIRRNLLAYQPVPHGRRIGFEDIYADSYQRIPDEVLPYRRGNTKLYDHLNEIVPT